SLQLSEENHFREHSNLFSQKKNKTASKDNVVSNLNKKTLLSKKNRSLQVIKSSQRNNSSTSRGEDMDVSLRLGPPSPTLPLSKSPFLDPVLVDFYLPSNWQLISYCVLLVYTAATFDTEKPSSSTVQYIRGTDSDFCCHVADDQAKDKDGSGKKKGRNKEGMPHDPSVLIEGVLFRARYLGSTQLVCEGQPTKSTRMMQAEEAVSRIKVSMRIIV
ncbi:hypothetical protein M8J77_013836, partial [Diaphorina citri]